MLGDFVRAIFELMMADRESKFGDDLRGATWDAVRRYRGQHDLVPRSVKRRRNNEARCRGDQRL
jgi:hypothetical protein